MLFTRLLGFAHTGTHHGLAEGIEIAILDESYGVREDVVIYHGAYLTRQVEEAEGL